jgi:hypothetical protein
MYKECLNTVQTGITKSVTGTPSEKASVPKETKPPSYLLAGGSHVSKVRDVDWQEHRPIRAGFIIYTTYLGYQLFCCGIDRKTSEITDFGGGISYKRDKSTLSGALRELTEESLGVFGSFNEEQLMDSVVCYNNYMAIFFLHLDCDILAVTSLFDRRFRSERTAEVSSLAWMDLDRFRWLIYKTGTSSVKPSVYERVTELLRPCLSKIIDLL